MNRFGSLFKPLTWFMALVLAALVAGCGGGSDDGGPPPAPIGLVGGNWTITETGTTASDPLCQPPPAPGVNELDTYGLVVVQNGNSLTVTKVGGTADFAGTINGDQMSWTGSYAEENGTTTITSLSATVGATCNTASGTSNWSYSEDIGGGVLFTCTGSTTFDAAEDAPQTDCAS